MLVRTGNAEIHGEVVETVLLTNVFGNAITTCSHRVTVLAVP